MLDQVDAVARRLQAPELRRHRPPAANHRDSNCSRDQGTATATFPVRRKGEALSGDDEIVGQPACPDHGDGQIVALEDVLHGLPAPTKTSTQRVTGRPVEASRATA